MQNEHEKEINIDIEIELIKKLYQIVSEQWYKFFWLFDFGHLTDSKSRSLKYQISRCLHRYY